jgi:hypothetical protein
VHRALLFALAASIGFLGCGLSGLDSETLARNEAGADATSSGDAGRDARSEGCGKVEDCANGVDDDCNGLVDCADPACMKAGFACTAGEVPTGWTLVAYSAEKRPVCPTWFEDEQAVVSDVDAGAATCTCNCSGSSAECLGTTAYSACGDGCVPCSSTTVNVNNGACSPIGTSLLDGDAYQLDVLGPEPQAQQGTCSGSGAVMGTPPEPTFHAGATCNVSTPTQAGCSGGAACAPPTGGAFKTCIRHTGTATCPTFGYTQPTLASTGTPGYVDTRACGSCPCATSLGCEQATLVTVYSGGGCTGSAYGINAYCPAIQTSTTGIASYTVGYATTGSSTCQPTASAPPTGTVTLDSHIETICCAP